MKMLTAALLLMLASPVIASQADDSVFYWIDDNGKVYLSDMKPPGAGATKIPLKAVPKIGSVKPQGSCDPSLRYQSEAKFWNKKQRRQRKPKKVYSCGM